MKKLLKICFVLNSAVFIHAQQIISVDELVDIAVENNYQMTVNEAEYRKAKLDRAGAVEIPKTGFFVENEDASPSAPDGEWKVGIEQELPWPGLFKARKKYLDQLIIENQMNREAIKAEIVRDVKKSYYELWYLSDKKELFQKLDSIYQSAFDAASLRFNVGDVAGLDKISAEVKLKENRAILNQIEKEIEFEQKQLMLLTNQQTFYLPENESLPKVELTSLLSDGVHPSLLPVQQQIEVSKSLIEVEKQGNRPDFFLRGFSQRYLGIDDPLSGFSFALSVPLFGLKPMRSRVQAIEEEVVVRESELKWEQMNLETQQEQAMINLDKEKLLLDFYEDSGLEQAGMILSAASLSYKSGEISFAEMSQFIIQAIEVKQNYLDSLNAYNQMVIEYNYLSEQN